MERELKSKKRSPNEEHEGISSQTAPPSYHDFTKYYIREKGVNRHHINSFNYFVDVEIKNLLKANSYIDSDIDPTFYIKYTSIRVEPPSVEENMVKRYVTPEECRIRNLTYAGDILVSIEYTRGKDKIVANDILIGRIPIMHGSTLSLNAQKTNTTLSKQPPPNTKRIANPRTTRPKGECPYDIGGYFICKGIERILLMQEQLAKNRVLIETDFKGDLSAVVTSTSLERKSKTKVVLKKKLLYVSHNSLAEDIPLNIVLKSMGMTTDMEIEFLVGLPFPPVSIRTELEALSWIGARIKTRAGGTEEARIFVSDIILAHIPSTATNLREKCEYLATMGRMLVEESRGDAKDPSSNDKDFVGNKRVELAGQMLSLLFEDLLKRLNSEMKKAVDRVLCKRARAQELNALHFLVMNRNIITTGLLRAISTGSWSLKRFKMDRAGITQVLTKLSRLSAIGMCSRVSSQFEKTRKVSGPRALHCSQWGVFCPSDTPEGEACGLVKSLAVLAEISTPQKEQDLEKILSYLGVEDHQTMEAGAGSAKRCWLNGVTVGVCRNPQQIAEELRKLRRRNRLPKTVSIWTASELFISTEGGRLCRPLIIVENGAPKLTEHEMKLLMEGYKSVDDLVEDGKIEYIDQNEAKNVLVSVWRQEITEKTTHLEIDPSSVLGHVAGVIPYPHHNQSPRNTYQCAMGKQGVGVTGVDHKRRMDGVNFFLVSPQKPLVSTRAIELINYNELPAGQNLTVAVLSMSGYDIEDALVMNKASIDRGVGRVLLFKTHSLSLRVYPGGGADTIPESGVLAPASKVTEGTVFIERTTPLGAKAGAVYRGLDNASVEKAALMRTGDDLITVKTVIKEHRVPRIGDKYSSRHGQKGVIGLVLPKEDMPFNERGMVPDLVMNPHGFPSRMTVGKILELVTGKCISAGSNFLNEYSASAFGGVRPEDIAEELLALGFSESGKEELICGTSGKRIPVTVFFGPVFYQRLKHMVADKMHARARGPRAVLTRQPTEGRCRDGGFRLGEMERDCLIGYGASEVLIERLVVSSDKYVVHVCSACGLIVGGTGCNSCPTGEVQRLQLPYACKLLFQELMSMKIAPRIVLKK